MSTAIRPEQCEDDFGSTWLSIETIRNNLLGTKVSLMPRLALVQAVTVMTNNSNNDDDKENDWKNESNSKEIHKPGMLRLRGLSLYADFRETAVWEL